MIKRVHDCGETSVPCRQNCRLRESKTTSEASLQFTRLKIAFVVDGKAAEIAECVLAEPHLAKSVVLMEGRGCRVTVGEHLVSNMKRSSSSYFLVPLR